jgi:hypothetical protein
MGSVPVKEAGAGVPAALASFSMPACCISSAVSVFDSMMAVGSQMKPYRSVRGGASLLNLVAVLSLALCVDKKKLPRFCRLSRTVGGLASSGTIEASSTDGGGVSSVGDTIADPARCSAIGGDTAVVGNGLVDDTLLSNDGRWWSSDAVDLDPRSVAPDTVDNRLLPIAKAVSPYPYPALASLAGVSDPLDLLNGESVLMTDVARDLELRRTVSRIVIPSSRALLTSE